MTTINRTTYLSGDCDRASLLELMRDGEHASNHDAVVDHLEHCETCREEYEEMAASQRDWETVREALLTSEWPSLNAGQAERWHLTMDADRHALSWNDQMARQLLSPPSHPEMLGRIGRYEVERLIGSGGMGVVFKAHDTELNRPVAIKLLAPYLAGNGPARKRFAREARAAAAIVHDHVVPIHNVEAEREVPYLVMQFIGGESLQARIDAQGALDLCEILRIGIQVASGLAAAHQQGLVHRDIKPSNILLEPTVDRAFITDFGLARAADDASLTHTGFHPGTPQYMSPEQAAGDSVDARSDLFSFGSVLYTMCTGRPPFRADTSLGVLRRIADSQPRPIQETNPRIPAWLCTLIERLMSKNPEARFSSAAEVASLLEQCLAHVQQPSVSPLPHELLAKANNDRRFINRAFIGMAAIASATLLWFAGTAIFLEWNKGTLRIESNSATDVPIRIKQGDKTVDELTVSNVGSNIQLQSGSYVIEIEGDHSSIEIVGEHVTIKRGDTWIAKIEKIDDSKIKATKVKDKLERADVEKSPAGKATESIQPGAPSIGPNAHPSQAYKSLESTVRSFNEGRGAMLKNFGCSLLTEEEVISALQWRIEHDEFDKQLKKQLQRIVWSRTLPMYWNLSGEPVDQNIAVDEVLRSYSIILRIDSFRPIQIRRQMIAPPKNLLTVADRTVDETSRPLEAAIADFNNSNRVLMDVKQPPLTLREVLASIADWANRRDEADVDDATFEKLQRIAKTHRLPDDTRFELISRFGDQNGETFYIWSVRILMPQVAKPGWTHAFIIRNQFVGMDSISLDEIHWGKPNENGLQAGFRFKPAQKVYTDGQEVEAEFFYRSVTGKAIAATVPNVFHFDSLVTLRDNFGSRELDRSEKVVGGWRQEHIGEQPTVFKGKRLIMLKTREDRVLNDHITPITLPQNTNAKISFIVPNFSDDSVDKLRTGEMELKIVSDDLSIISGVAPAPIDTGLVPLQRDADLEALDKRLREITQITPSVAPYQGEWEVVEMKLENSDQLQFFVDHKATMIIEGNQFQFDVHRLHAKDEDKAPYLLSSFELRGIQAPQYIDVSSGLSGELPGIIEVEGDTLQLCFWCAGQVDQPRKRPEKFESSANVFYVKAKRK